MRSIIALAAALVLNVAALGALEWSAHQAQVAPVGEVLITQLPEPGDPLYAHIGEPRRTTAL
jgi:hypothetical protein